MDYHLRVADKIKERADKLTKYGLVFDFLIGDAMDRDRACVDLRSGLI